MKIKTLFCIISGLFCFNSCHHNDYYDLIINEDITQYSVVYEDEYGHQQTEHIVDFELINRSKVRVWFVSETEEGLESKDIKAPFEILTHF